MGWTEKATRGATFGTSHVQFPMPPPMQFPAPLLPPSSSRRGRFWLVVIPLAVLVVVVVAIVSRSSRGGSFLTADSPATTVDRVAAECIARSLAEVDRLASTAEVATQKFRSTSWAGDSSYLDYGKAVSVIGLTGCPSAYRSQFQQFASANVAYGKWIEAHTGRSHSLAGSDRTGMRTLQQAIVATNDLMMEVVRDYRPDLVRTIQFTAG